MTMITTVGQFINALGGGVKAAPVFDTNPTTVSNWKVADRFPAWAAMRAREIAEVNKFAVDPRLYETRPVRIDRSRTKNTSKRRTAKH